LKYSEVASLELEIERRNQPNIDRRDTIRAGEYFELTALDEDLKMFDLEEWYWDMGDGTRQKGKGARHAYSKPGVYRISLGAISFPEETTDKRKQVCVYKDIVVMSEDAEGIADRDDFANPAYKVVSASKGNRAQHFLPDNAHGTYYVEILRSRQRIPYNAPVFNKVKGEIVERYIKEEEVYTYSVGEVASVAGVYDVFRSLADSGYTEIKVKGDVVENFDLQTMKKGSFISKEDTTAINREFHELRNVKFAYNSEEILEESFPNLNYIISMLEVEPSYRIAINAHTDNIGSEGFNQKLSERRADAVVKYFGQSGIDKERMVWKGFGATQPVADNATEEGRAQNRRVEFLILDNQKTAEK
jgi:outer membrane protein OmpA-like peptidoglycan-associated protein